LEEEAINNYEDLEAILEAVQEEDINPDDDGYNPRLKH